MPLMPRKLQMADGCVTLPLPGASVRRTHCVTANGHWTYLLSRKDCCCSTHQVLFNGELLWLQVHCLDLLKALHTDKMRPCKSPGCSPSNWM